MTLTRKIIFSVVIAALILATAIVAGWTVQKVGAAASDFSQSCATNTNSTTTLAYMTSGTGTTTLACPIGAMNRLANSLVSLQLQVTASSTAVDRPTLNARVEYSFNNIDWYANVLSSAGVNQTLDSTGATTTPMTSDPYNTLSFKMSTSTASGFGGTGTGTRILLSAEIPARAPYMRVIFTSPQGGGNIGLWAEIIGKLNL